METNVRARQLINEIMNHLIDCDHIDSTLNSKVIQLFNTSSVILTANSPLTHVISEFANDWCIAHETVIIPNLRELIDLEVFYGISSLSEMIKILTDSIATVRDDATKIITTGIYLSDVTTRYNNLRLGLSGINRSLNTHMIIAEEALKSIAIKIQLKRLESVVDKMEVRLSSLENTISLTKCKSMIELLNHMMITNRYISTKIESRITTLTDNWLEFTGMSSYHQMMDLIHEILVFINNWRSNHNNIIEPRLTKLIDSHSTQADKLERIIRSTENAIINECSSWITKASRCSADSNGLIKLLIEIRDKMIEIDSSIKTVVESLE